MKTRIPTAVLGRTLQVASAFYTTTPHLSDAETMSPSVFGEHRTRAINEDFRVFALDERDLEVSPPITFAVPQQWNTKSAGRFKDLVEREAMGVATPDEIAQLEALSALRRRAVIPRTGEEVLREYEQGQLVRELLRSLTRYVEFAKQSDRWAE